MEAVINIEDRLRTIEAIFKLSIEAKVFPDDIYIYTIYQKWETNLNFRSESLSLSLEDPRYKNTLEIINNLSNDIIALYDQLKMLVGEIKKEYIYKIQCMPSGSGMRKLYLVKWWLGPEDSKSPDGSKFVYGKDLFQFIDGKWWPFKRMINEENSDFICTTPLFLIDFVLNIHQFLKERILLENNTEPSSTNLKRLMSIPTKADQKQILEFWFKLQGNNEKGDPYWDNKTEIEHFVNQNFDIFPGVDEKRVFNPNMSKSELNHVTWTFYHKYGMNKTKKQYEKLLMLNFTKFKDDNNVYSNIKDKSNEHLKKLFK